MWVVSGSEGGVEKNPTEEFYSLKKGGETCNSAKQKAYKRSLKKKSGLRG